MNDLTESVIGTGFKNLVTISLNESLKQSRTFDFESGTTQTIGNKSVPSIIVDLSYNAIDQATYQSLESSYQNNHSNTFLIDLGEDIDPRILYDLPNNGVWAFSNFSFDTSIQLMNKSEKRYSGKITIITSVLFNYVQFQELYNQPSSYSANITTDTSFLDVLDLISPQKVSYSYELNKLFKNSGQSVSTQRDLGNSKRTWKLEFFCQQAEWIELITYFRKKGGINPFGMPEEGYFIAGGTQNLINARFMKDSFRHQILLNNVYTVSFEMIEVK